MADEKITVQIEFSALPGSCRVTGEASVYTGHEYEGGGPNPPAVAQYKTVLSFENELLSSVRRKLSGKKFTNVELKSVRFR